MGLAERRAIKEFKDDHFEGLKEKIDEAAGFKTVLHVEWDTIAVEDYSHMYVECFQKVFFEPVVKAFESICADDMGRDALKDSLKRIVFQNTKGKSNASGFTYSGGILTLDHKPTYNVDAIKERADFLVKMLEEAL